MALIHIKCAAPYDLPLNKQRWREAARYVSTQKNDSLISAMLMPWNHEHVLVNGRKVYTIQMETKWEQMLFFALRYSMVAIDKFGGPGLTCCDRVRQVAARCIEQQKTKNKIYNDGRTKTWPLGQMPLYTSGR